LSLLPYGVGNQFDGNWSTQFLDNYRVPVADGTSMLVFTEGATGVRATYWFQLNKNQHVWIGVANGDENIIYIHAMMRSE
jgi:hypothetical protein